MKIKMVAQIQTVVLIAISLGFIIWSVTWFLQGYVLSDDEVFVPYFVAMVMSALALALALGIMHFRSAPPLGRLGCITYWIVAAGCLLYDARHNFSGYEPIAWIIGIAVAYVFFFRKKEEEMVAGIIAES